MSKSKCVDCAAAGEPCGYHLGFGDGWDAAASAASLPAQDDAWKQYMDLFDKFYSRSEVRSDLIVEAIGVDRAVKLTVKWKNPHAQEPLSLNRWNYHSTQRNVSTMRELAAALIAACDLVDGVNPVWASKRPSDGEKAALREQIRTMLKS